ncbi:MAG TPA: aldehyde dehydrogenase family protein, partial [Kofleriaceae bacterium]|nr:aldehyde dehydrogenase family protein [Kofleriaceae bacterium]
MAYGGLDEKKIEEIVSRVLDRLGGSGGVAKAPPHGNVPAAAASHNTRKANVPRGTNGVYADAESAVKAARRAFEQNEKTSVSTRVKMVEAMRRAVLSNNEALSQAAVDETGLGRYEDKLAKNRLVAEKTPGVEILKTVAYTGDHGLMLTERAPYGVILAITPTTNP